MCFHELRHTFAPHAIAGGVDVRTLSGILGHANASFTFLMEAWGQPTIFLLLTNFG